MDLIGIGDCWRRDRRRKDLPITLEKILNLSHILLGPVLIPGEVAAPFRRAPDLHAVVHSHEDELLILIHWDELAEAAWN